MNDRNEIGNKKKKKQISIPVMLQSYETDFVEYWNEFLRNF